MAEPFNIIHLPEHILIQMFSYMSYNEISESRQVCQTFNRVCSRELTKAFVRVDRLHSQIQKNIKSQLPRKESERRNHALSRFVDVLSAMETRLSLLSMTYTKYIDLDLCCFIPGKVLDEMYRLLYQLQNTETQPPRSYDLLQGLRDLSTMAMEHFEEFIVPILKAQMNECSQSLYFSGPSSSPSLTLNTSIGSGPFASSMDMSGVPLLDYSWAMPLPMVSTPWRRTPLKLDVQRVQSQMQMHSAAIATMTKEYREQKVKIGEQSRMIAEQDRKLQEQSRLMSELKAHMQAQEKNLEILASHLATVTGKEVALPKPMPWDQTLGEHAPRASTSSQDSAMAEEVAFIYPEASSRETPRKTQYRQLLAERDAAEAKSKEVTVKVVAPPKPEACHHSLFPACPKQRGQCSSDCNHTHSLEQIVSHMNELCPGLSSACPTQRLLAQIALKIQTIAADHSLPVCLGEASLERTVDAKDPSSVLGQLATAQRQLSSLHEEHGGCTLCSEAVTSAFASMHPSTSSQETDLFSATPPTNQGLFNRAQELYNRLLHLKSEPLDTLLPAPGAKEYSRLVHLKSEPLDTLLPTPGAKEVGSDGEDVCAEPARGRGKNKGPLKRRCAVLKSEVVKVEADEDSKAARGRKRRRR